MNHTLSKEAFLQATHVLPGGVDSPVRSFSSVGGEPIFVEHATGATIVDLDGNEYIDYIGSWGPMILGHAHPVIEEALIQTYQKGISYGLPCTKETELANLIVDAYPGLEMVRFVTSGTEATMSAIRVARGYTNKDKIIKFEGCYHGHHDGLLVKSGSGPLTFGTTNSQGVPASMISDTIVCTYNDITSVETALVMFPDQIAAIILEPVAANMGVVSATPEFLSKLRRLCDEHNIVLIFDEVITGFRLSYGGAASVYGITPDLTCFGKIIGAGMSVGAYGGKKELMSLVSPLGGVYQAGTLAGNPLAMACGIAQLTYLNKHLEIYTQLETMAAYMQRELQAICNTYQAPIQINRAGSLMTLFFTTQTVHSFQDVSTCDLTLFSRFHQGMLEEGILLAPSQYEAIFLSSAHTKEMIDQTVLACERVLKNLV